MSDRPDIKQALSSLKNAMTADKDLSLEDDCYDDSMSFKNTVSDETVLEAEDMNILEEVFSSEDLDLHEANIVNEDVVTIKTAKSEDKVFVLTRMIQDDGTVVNLDCNTARPQINISDEQMECIVREEVRPLIKDWLEKNMHSVFNKMKKKK